MRLGQVIAGWRYAERIGVREVAKKIGVSAATLNRIERGENCDASSLAKILNWLFAEGQPSQRRLP